MKSVDQIARSPLIVRRAGWRGPHGAVLQAGTWTAICAIGRSGMTARKREGDGATPIAAMRIADGYCRRDRVNVARPSRQLKPIAADLGWCDAPGHSRYNRPVRLPFAASHEAMARSDSQYDYCLVLDWNLQRRSANRGSAIFLHLRRDDAGPTAGCIAVSRATMRRLLAHGVLGRRVRTVG